MEPYWNEANGHAPHPVKYESEAAVSSFPYCTESSLNFSTSATAYSEDDAEYATGRRNKTSRQDPLSHRIIEKRRRDRMNSCLADLSRLIPPQYQRKGRGRIEKTEIIEMAIRHLKHLQSECMQKESEYRMGYTDCMKEAAKFLYDSQMQEFCYRLLARLQEHIDEVTKTDCYKSRGNACHMPDNVSASSGSPHQVYPPLCHLRDMLGASDIEHSNDHNDVKDLSFRNHLNQLQRNNNIQHQSTNGGVGIGSGAGSTTATVAVVAAAAAAAAAANAIGSSEMNGGKTSLANNSIAPPPPSVLVGTNANAAISSGGGGANTSSSSSSSSVALLAKSVAAAAAAAAAANGQQSLPHQAAVITSTGHGHHTDSSNHDFESSREPLLHTDTSNMHSPPPRDSLLHHHSHLAHNHHTTDSLLSLSRMRNFSESSHEIEHNNNYKYKNHIKERFNHELHDEETSSEHCPAGMHLQSDHTHSHSEHSKDGTEPDIAPIMAKKRKLAEAVAASDTTLDAIDGRGSSITTTTNGNGLLSVVRDEKPFSFSDIKSELHNHNSNSNCGLLDSVAAAKAAVVAAQLNSAPSSTTAPLPPAAMTMARPSFAVPIFALHGQGNYYVPLNVDYNVLLPYLNGVDLLEKNYTTMPVVHPININVNFMPTTPSASLLAAAAAAAAVAAGKQQAPPGANNATNTNAAAAAAVAKAKLEAISHSW